MKTILINYLPLLASVWYFAAGLLHDIFIIKNHKGNYNRDLLRLLMDGHILMFSGLIAFISFLMLKNNILYANIILLTVAISMLAYCTLIFPFLKSFATIVLSSALVICSVYSIASN
jgi:glucose-6-phosphate-specific signal transduction histidine kinase